MKGKGQVTLTGKLGDVMKESAYAGLSYLRSKAHELGIPEDFHEKLDIHIHVPEVPFPRTGLLQALPWPRLWPLLYPKDLCGKMWP